MTSGVSTSPKCRRGPRRKRNSNHLTRLTFHLTHLHFLIYHHQLLIIKSNQINSSIGIHTSASAGIIPCLRLTWLEGCQRERKGEKKKKRKRERERDSLTLCNIISTPNVTLRPCNCSLPSPSCSATSHDPGEPFLPREHASYAVASIDQNPWFVWIIRFMKHKHTQSARHQFINPSTSSCIMDQFGKYKSTHIIWEIPWRDLIHRNLVHDHDP